MLGATGRTMKISRLTLFVCTFLAMPALLPAQETKLTNCRSLEAAGNYVGPDEVLDGERVCKKAKPGDISTAKPENTKPVSTVISDAAPVSVAEAARANAAAKAAARKVPAETEPQPANPEQKVISPAGEPVKPPSPSATPAPIPSPETAVPPSAPTQSTRPADPIAAAPAPAVAPLPVESRSAPAEPSSPAAKPPEVVTPEPVKPSPEPAAPPAAPPDSVAPASESPAPVAARAPVPQPASQPTDEPGPAFISVVAPVVKVQPATAAAGPSSPVPRAAPAAPVRLHRDAPVAPGTPSEPPEIDYGFSDANAVEAPRPASDGSAGARSSAQTSSHGVQLGGFGNTPNAAAQATGANPQPAMSEAKSACAKNITIGNLRDGKLSLGAAPWAENWIARNQKRLENVCFLAAPVKGARNYLVVFYTAPGSGRGRGGTGMPLPDATGGAGDFTAKDGSTWHYAAERSDTAAAPSSDGGLTQVWYATAYTEEGTPVAERWPDSSKPAEEERVEDLLNAMVEDLRKLGESENRN